MGVIEKSECSTSLLELIEFNLDRTLSSGETKTGKYGINVAKVREVVRMPVINPLSSSVTGVAGVFELRGVPIPAINLSVALGDAPMPYRETDQIIVAEFSRKRAGFIVKSTQRIRRVPWNDVLPPASDRKTCINGMTLIEDNEFLFILDLERIIYDIEKIGGMLPDVSETSKKSVASNGQTVLLVDDSALILSSTAAALEGQGYQVLKATNGIIAQKMLTPTSEAQRLSIDAIVSDVEMPQLDGFSLTHWIKNESTYARIPVILHTSLSGDSPMERGRQAGADDYVLKNDMSSLFSVLNRLIGEKKTD